MSLNDFGWNDYFEAQRQTIENKNLAPARVVRRDLSRYRLINDSGEFAGEVSGKFQYDHLSAAEYPAVGDWVMVDMIENENKGIIHAVLPRKGAFSRLVSSSAGGRKARVGETEEQIVAANVDTAFLVSGLDHDFNLRRIERYLTLAWDSGATPVLVLNKADLCDNIEERIAEIETVAVGSPIHAVSAETGDGVDELETYLSTGKTCVFLGSSGVGKSSLINRLLGEEKMKINRVSEHLDRGQHTTTHRELIHIPGRGMVIDTPGMRELQLWSDEESLHKAFADIEELAQNCRFTDCKHEDEPDCAVRAAVESGSITAERWASYLKQRKELAYLVRRVDASAARAERDKWKRIAMYQRSRTKQSPKK